MEKQTALILLAENKKEYEIQLSRWNSFKAHSDSGTAKHQYTTKQLNTTIEKWSSRIKAIELAIALIDKHGVPEGFK